jgi:ABC-type multidrug transport system permease subunit
MTNPIASTSRKFYGFLKKDILLMTRRKKYLYLMILIPLLIGLIFLFFLNPAPRDVKIGVCDYDGTVDSHASVSNLPGFVTTFLPIENCTQNLISQIKSKKLSLGIEIPKGFSQTLASLKQAKLIVYYDNMDIAFANLVDWKVDSALQPYEKNIINNLNSEIKSRVAAIRSGVDIVLAAAQGSQTASQIQQVDSNLKTIEEIDTEFILNPIYTEKQPVYAQAETKDIGIAFVFPIVAIFVVLMLSSSSLIYDRKSNFLVRVKSSTSPIIYLLAKLVFFFLVTAINFIIILLLFIMYGANYALSFPHIINLLAFISVTNTLLGMIIGLISDNEGIAILFSFVVSFPFMLLSGIFYPTQTMPVLVQYLARIIPLNYHIEASKTVLLFGQSIGLKWVLVAVALFVLVYLMLKRKQ